MDIEKIKEKEYNIKEALKQHFEDEIASDIGICSYLIFPDGTLIGGYAHRDFFDYLIDNGILTTEEVGEYDTDIFNTLFNCVRCTDLENENYIGLPTNRLTEEQFKALKEWLENNFELGRKEILVTANFKKENEAGVTYNYAKIIEDGDWPSDYIINRIKRYYSSGKLVEDIEAEVAEDAIVDKIKSLLPKYGHPVFFDDNNNLMLDDALDTLFNFMSDQWSVWVDDTLVDSGNLETMLDKFLEVLDNNTDKRVELCAGNTDGLLYTYLVSDPTNYLFVREDIEEVAYDDVLTPSEEENHTWKLDTEQLMILKDWQDKYYDVARGPGTYHLNYDSIIRRQEAAGADGFEIREIHLVRKTKLRFKGYSTISYDLIIEDTMTDAKSSYTLVSLDALDNIIELVVKWDEPKHTPYIQQSFDKFDSICKLEEMLGLGNYTKNKVEEMVEYFKKELPESLMTEDIEETKYEDEPIYCVTMSLGNDETVMCYLLNEEFKLRLINNGLLDDIYSFDDNGLGKLLAVDWLYFVASSPSSVLHNCIMIPALQSGTVGYRNLLSHMNPEQLIHVSALPRKLITSWPMNEDVEEGEWEISHLIDNSKGSYAETKTWTLDDKALKLLEELQAKFPTSQLHSVNFKRLIERYDSFMLTRETYEYKDLFHCYTIYYRLHYFTNSPEFSRDDNIIAYLYNKDFNRVAANNVVNKDKQFEVKGDLKIALERAEVLEDLEKTLCIEEFTKTKLEEATAELEKLIANNNAKHQKIEEDIAEEPYDDKFMSLINLQIISDYAADHLDGGGWIWRDYGIIGVDNPMAGPYIAGIFKATDDPNKFIRYDLDSIPEDILSDEELSYMNPEETEEDEYVPNLMYALESKDNHTITDIINKIEANANQETMTLKAALNFIEEYWGTDEELDSWIKDEQEYHFNNDSYLNIVEKLNEEIEEEPYVDSSGACADITLLKTAYNNNNDERYWIWEMPAEVLVDISKKYDTYNLRSFDRRLFDFESLSNDPDFSWRIKRVITDDGSGWVSRDRRIHTAAIHYMYYCYCKADHEVVNYRYQLISPLRIYTGKQFDEEESITLNKIRELDTLLGVPEKYRIDNIIEQINSDYLDLYEDIKEEPIDISSSDDNIINVIKLDSFLGKYKYRSIYYDINLDKTELVNYLLDLYREIQLVDDNSEEDIEHDIRLIRDRKKDCILYISYKPSEDNYRLGIYDPNDYSYTLGLVEIPKDIAKKIIGDKLVTDLIQEDIEEVPPTEKDFLPEYSSKYLNWDKDTEGRKKSIEIINNHWNDKIWFLLVGSRDIEVYSPRKYMTFAEAYHDFVTYDTFPENDELNNYITLNAKGFALSFHEISKNYSCIFFRSKGEPDWTPDMSIGLNEDIKEIPQQYNIDVDPINNSDIYRIFNNYTTCDCDADVKDIVTRDRDKKRWYVTYYNDLWADGEVITRELVTFDEAFKIFLGVNLDNTANSYALILTKLTEEEKRKIKRGNTIEPFYITSDRFEWFLQELGEL